MNYLQVKHWEEFQHYKDRSPPWIKLHRDLLRDYNFICLKDASKLHLVLIWLLASQLDNKIPADEKYIRNQIGVKGEIDLKDLIDNGFLIDASNMLASCYQHATVGSEPVLASEQGAQEENPKCDDAQKSATASNSLKDKDKTGDASKLLASCKQSAIGETETETETEKDIYIKNSFSAFWEIYPRKVDKKKAEKSFKAAIKKVPEPDVIIEQAKSYANQCKVEQTEQKFIKHASTWLNNHCWEEQYDPRKQKVTIDQAVETLDQHKRLRYRRFYFDRENENAFRQATGFGFSDIQ